MLADTFTWFHLWLILHVTAVIVAFGPDFAFPLIARQIQKHPEHAVFGTEIIHVIEERLTLPLSVAVPLLGTALIYTGHFNLWKSEWLIIAIVVYIVTFFFAMFVQLPNTSKMIRLLQSMPPGPPPPGATPPPEVVSLGKKLQFGGMYLALAIVSLVVLMIWRPGSCQGIC